MEVRNPSGEVITTPSCNNFGYAFIEDLTLDVTGSYLLAQRDGGSNESGGYQINLQCLFGPCPGQTDDTDGDSISDNEDNCTLVPNPDQHDTDGDDFGNLCDPDLNNDNRVNSVDFGIFRSRFFSTDPDADLNGDSRVNSVDFGIARDFFLKAPGPSGLVP